VHLVPEEPRGQRTDAAEDDREALLVRGAALVAAVEDRSEVEPAAQRRPVAAQLASRRSELLREVEDEVGLLAASRRATRSVRFARVSPRYRSRTRPSAGSGGSFESCAGL
jgi:hypothetical protein